MSALTLWQRVRLRPRHEQAAALLLCLVTLVYIGKGLDSRGDFMGYARAGYQAAHGIDIYAHNPRNIWPPFCAVAFMPVGVPYYLSFDGAPDDHDARMAYDYDEDHLQPSTAVVCMLWVLFSCWLVWDVLRLCAVRLYARPCRLLPRGPDDLWPGSPQLVLPVLICLRPLLSTLDHLQLTPLILWSVVRGALLVRDRPRQAGWLVAVVSMIKMLPGIVLPYALWRKSWRFVGSFILASLACLSAVFVWFGPQAALAYHFYYRTLRSGYIPVRAGNQSPLAVLDRLLGYGLPPFPLPDDFALVASGTLLSTLAMGGFVLGFALLCLVVSLTLRRTATPAVADVFDTALLSLAVLYISPTSWDHYYMLLLVPAMVAIAGLWRGWLHGRARTTSMVLLVLGTLLLFVDKLAGSYALKQYALYLGPTWYGSLLIFAALLLTAAGLRTCARTD